MTQLFHQRTGKMRSELNLTLENIDIVYFCFQILDILHSTILNFTLFYA